MRIYKILQNYLITTSSIGIVYSWFDLILIRKKIFHTTIDLALYIIQDVPHWGPMDPCGGPVDMYSQTGDWAPESPMATIKVIFEGPLEAQK